MEVSVSDESLSFDSPPVEESTSGLATQNESSTEETSMDDSTDPTQCFDTFMVENFIFDNQSSAQGRYKDFKFFCRLCEYHVRDYQEALRHVRCNTDHMLYLMRHQDRIEFCSSWRKNPPIKPLKFKYYLETIELEVIKQMTDFYTRCRFKDLQMELGKLKNYVDGYTVQFMFFGSYPAFLMCRDNPLIDLYVLIKKADRSEATTAQKLVVLKKLPFTNLTRCKTAFNGYKINWDKFASAKFFITCDPNAWNAVLASRLIALYTHFCPRIFALAHVFRAWARNIGFLKWSVDFRVSGAIFDYMVIYFFQNYLDVPVIDEATVGCPLNEFLNKDIEEQLEILTPIFANYINHYSSMSISVLFTNLILFYGCGFSYENCIQITSAASIPKENRGIRTIRVLDPINSELNIFVMRAEHAIHFENMIFFGTYDYLQPYDSSNYVDRLSNSLVSGSGYRDFKLPLLHLDRPESSTLKSTTVKPIDHTLQGAGIWCPDIINRPSAHCFFCHRGEHTMYDCWLLELKNINGLPNSDVCKSLSKCISYWYKKTRLTDEDVDNAMTFIAELTLIILQKAGLSVELHAFGSLTSGFGATNSDFDLCIKKVGVDLLDKESGIALLALVSDALKSVEGYVVEEIFNARVPILTLKCKRDDTTLKADLSFSNFLALKNTKMLAVYAAFDDRVAPLGIAIKKWANIFGLNNASNGTFKSYALTIMLIHYLQRVEPPVLPNLQCAETFKLEDEFLDKHKVQFAQPTEDFRLEFSKNKMTMGELYVGFFEYFGGQFDFHDEVVQIRSKDKLYKMDKDWTRSEICIEDPFDLTHNLTSGIRTSNSLHIFKCINIMRNEFRKRQSVFLDKNFHFDCDVFKLLTKLNGRNSMKCYNCNEYGHLQDKCTKKMLSKPKPRQTYQNKPSYQTKMHSKAITVSAKRYPASYKKSFHTLGEHVAEPVKLEAKPSMYEAVELRNFSAGEKSNYHYVSEDELNSGPSLENLQRAILTKHELVELVNGLSAGFHAVSVSNGQLLLEPSGGEAWQLNVHTARSKSLTSVRTALDDTSSKDVSTALEWGELDLLTAHSSPSIENLHAVGVSGSEDVVTGRELLSGMNTARGSASGSELRPAFVNFSSQDVATARESASGSEVRTGRNLTEAATARSLSSTSGLDLIRASLGQAGSDVATGRAHSATNVRGELGNDLNTARTHSEVEVRTALDDRSSKDVATAQLF